MSAVLKMQSNAVNTKRIENASRLSLAYFQNQVTGPIENTQKVLEQYVSEAVQAHVSHPINDLTGQSQLLDQYWAPLFQSFPDLERRDDIVLAGVFEDRVWAAATGHFVGTFENNWLGIPASQAATFIRFGEIVEIESDRITKSYVILDVVDVARQAGTRLIPKSLGAEHIAPGPATRDGILATPQDETESSKSLALVERMMNGLHEFDGQNVDSTHQNDFWHPNMLWYGPSGIGTTRGLKGFQDYHQKPFLTFIPDRVGGHHYARIASGHYIASGGWPSVKATTSGAPWVSTAISANQKIGMRVMDFWRREGNQLKENWVLIDIPDILYQCGIDVFAQLQSKLRK